MCNLIWTAASFKPSLTMEVDLARQSIRALAHDGRYEIMRNCSYCTYLVSTKSTVIIAAIVSTLYLSSPRSQCKLVLEGCPCTIIRAPLSVQSDLGSKMQKSEQNSVICTVSFEPSLTMQVDLGRLSLHYIIRAPLRVQFEWTRHRSE